MPTEAKIALSVVSIIVLIALGLILAPFTVVGVGERAVILNWGKYDRTLEPGFHFVNPISESVHTLDVTLQKEEIQAGASSKDLQDVNTSIAVNYELDPIHAQEIWTQFRDEYSARVIAPAIQESVKAATALYTAEELITKRDLVKEKILNDLKGRLSVYNIVVRDVLITNFGFSQQFNVAIEGKVKAEQDALKAKNDLQRVQFEADQKVATAEAEAKSIRLQSDAANNPRYVELKKLEVQLEYAKKWNGVLPVNLYGNAPIPLIDVTNGK